jgi:ribosome-associated protein
MEFKLSGNDYIELKNLLKAAGLCEHGGMAKSVISEGLVRVDGAVELRKGCKIKTGQIVTYAGKTVKVV